MIARHSITLFRSVEALTNNEVRISVTASAVLDVVTLEMITSKLRQVRATITTCSALPNHEENAAAVSAARASMDVEVLKRLEHNDVGVTAGLLLRQFSIAIKTQQAGNCYEYSLLMQFLLSKSSLRSEIFRISGGNHVFIVVNRDQGLSASDYKKWNPETIIIDPFLQSVYLASELQANLQSCVHDTDKNIIDYVAFNPAMHILTNDVLENLVEDWQRLMVASRAKRNYA